MSLQGGTPWDSEEDPESRRLLVRPKSAKGRNRPTSAQVQGRQQPRPIGCEVLTQKSTEETLEQGTSTLSKEDPAGHRTRSQNIWKSKTIDRDMRLGSGRTQSAHALTNTNLTGSFSTLQAKDMNFPQPTNVNTKNMNLPLPARVNAKDMNVPLPAKVNTKGLNFPLPAKAPCTLNKYSILPAIGCIGECPSRLQAGLCSEDSGA